MIKLKHLLTEQINFVSKRRARAELKQKIEGKRADDMGAYTGKIFGLKQEDQNAPRTEITSMEELDSGEYSVFALGYAGTPEIGNVGSALKFKMPRKRAGLFFAPANREYIEYDIDYKDDILDDEGKPETAYITVDVEYAEAAKKILDYMAPGVYELITGDEIDVSGTDVKFEVVGPDEAEVIDAISILNRDMMNPDRSFRDKLKVQDGTGRELNGQYVVTVTKTGGSEPRQYIIDSNKYLKDRGYDTELK